MSLFCRKSLHPHLLKISDFTFEVTIEAMKLYESFFGYNFAFNKYDQIFVPEYNWGAMENAGLVTFNDMYVFKEDVSVSRISGYANTITVILTFLKQTK